jgi:hypothetical protein
MSGGAAKKEKGRLGFIEATSVIAGYGIGEGILARPCWNWLVAIAYLAMAAGSLIPIG